MTIDLNNTSDQWLDDWKDMVQKGIYVADPTKQMNITTTDTNGIFGGVLNNQHTYEPYVDPMESIYTRLEKLELANILLRLNILSLEGKFTQEEVANIRKMLMSKDESSKTLAESIIENA